MSICRPGARWIALTALLAGCGGAGAAKIPVRNFDLSDASEAHRDGGPARDAAVEIRPARCCVVPTFASYSPYAGCNLLNLVPDAAVDLVQACWDSDAGTGTFGRWQCGGQSGQDTWCTDGALNCAAGDLCWVGSEDSTAGGCPGSVQPCSSPWR